MRKDERCYAWRIKLAKGHKDRFMNSGRLLWRKKLIEQLTLIFETIKGKILDRRKCVGHGALLLEHLSRFANQRSRSRRPQFLQFHNLWLIPAEQIGGNMT